jgi:hypothetical protein
VYFGIFSHRANLIRIFSIERILIASLTTGHKRVGLRFTHLLLLQRAPGVSSL